MTDMSASEFFRQVADVLQTAEKHPHGPPVQGSEQTIAGQSCVALCDGDADRARALWKLVQQDLGYMPRAAAVALIRASATTNLVPDVQAPDPQ